MLLQQLFCFSHEPSLPLTLCHSHHCCLTFGRRRGRLCCYTSPICPMSFHAVDHDAAAWHSGRRKDFGRYTGGFQAPLPFHSLSTTCTLMHTIGFDREIRTLKCTLAKPYCFTSMLGYLYSILLNGQQVPVLRVHSPSLCHHNGSCPKLA